MARVWFGLRTLLGIELLNISKYVTSCHCHAIMIYVLYDTSWHEAMWEFRNAKLKMAKHVAEIVNPDLLDKNGELPMDSLGRVDISAEIAHLLDTDSRTSTMLCRHRILSAFVEDEAVKTDHDILQMQEKLWNLIHTDEYLAETIVLQSTCSTIGRIKYIREFLLNLQTTSEKVMKLNDDHRDMLTTFSVVSKALLVEVQQVVASAAAEQKAALDEQKARLSEQTRLEKKRKAEQARLDKKLSKEQQKKDAADAKRRAIADREAGEAAAAAEQGGELEGEGNTRKTRARRVRVSASEFSEADPVVLREKFPIGRYMVARTSLDAFLHATCEGRLECLRMKSAMKAVIMSYSNMSKETGGSFMKQITAATRLETVLFF